MSNPPQKAKTTSTSGGPFAKRPRVMLVKILEFFTIYEVAQLQRFVCREFRDAGQERIRERGGRKLFEQGMAFFHGMDHESIDKNRGDILFQASMDAGCKIALVEDRMTAPNLSDEDKQKILKDLKEIGTSPYNWVDYFIADCYERGWGGEEKKDQAVIWFEKSVQKGNTRAMYDLGVSYHKGNLGLTQSDAKANELFALAAEKGHAIARYNLGNSYRLGRGGLAIDFNRCVELWDQSAKQGLVETQVDLGKMYGLGSKDGPPMTIPVDPQLSFRWYLAAAKQGVVKAMMKIGRLYYLGRGVEKKDESTLEWYTKAGQTGNQVGQYNLGYCYEHGRGCEIDLAHAMHWYQKSAAKGKQRAIDAVERLKEQWQYCTTFDIYGFDNTH